MSKPESKIQREILIAANRGNCRLFRNNIAKLKIRGRWTSFGIPGPGGADLVGWTTKKVTDDMVGTDVAIFTSIEVKTPTGRPSAKQTAWLDLVRSVGGIAKIARSPDDL